MAEEREVKQTVIKIGGFVGLTVYLAIGILSYLWFGEYEVFTWTDPWLYVYVGLWPFLLIFWGGLIVIGIVAVIALCAVLLDSYEKRKRRREMADARRSRTIIKP